MISSSGILLGCVTVYLSITIASAINECYTCNSVYDADCEHNPSNAYKKSCADPIHQNKTPAVGCRKIKQEINDNPRIIRQCAYSGGEMKAIKRTGNKGVRVFYWQCLNEDNCNSAFSSKSSVVMAILIPILAFFTLSNW